MENYGEKIDGVVCFHFTWVKTVSSDAEERVGQAIGLDEV
jgi:hypothetical protein